jgi:hypothetical protein
MLETTQSLLFSVDTSYFAPSALPNVMDPHR